MDLRQLEMFQAIVETGSFTKAGEKLFVSQSAISRQIKLLEEELGDQLFKRNAAYSQQETMIYQFRTCRSEEA